MKATGIVRRIDDLGRVVIPKEIRRTMRIREGDPLEIYTDNDGEVIFKKYSPLGELSNFATGYAEALAKGTEFSVVICDRDHCIAASGISKREVLGRRISASLEELIEARKSYIVRSDDKRINALEGIEKSIAVAMPVISAGDVTGAVVLLDNGDKKTPSDSDTKITTVAALFLGKQMED